MTRVGEVLRGKASELVTIDAHADVLAAVRLLEKHQIGGLPVLGTGGELVGFVGERDVIRAVDRNAGSVRDLPVSRFMQNAPTCTIDDPLHEVMSRMTQQRFRQLIVMDGGRLAGIISLGDIVKHRLDQLEMETGVLRDYLIAHRAAT
jgi:CBS domain-containing protein